MQSEAMIRKAAEAIWAIRREEEDRCDMSLDDMGGEESSVWHEAKAALEAALSTDAEPVGYATEYGVGYLAKKSWSFNLSMTKEADNINNVPLYAAPPAPAVAVKALEWREDWGGSDDDIVEWVADTPWGRVFASVAGYRDAEGKHYERHADVPDDLRIQLQSDTEAHHKARIRSALSAQVQDVAGWKDICTAPKDGTKILAVENFNYGWEDENGVAKTRPGDWCVVSWHPQHEEWIGFGMMLSSFTPTHWMPLPAAPAAKQGEAE